MTKTRKLWFVTRPERDPAFHVEALIALNEAVGGFPSKWEGEREKHKEYERVLGEHGLKRKSVSRDGSGGRTWAAMMRTYNYVYVVDGYLHLTKVGKALLNGENVRENITKQIMNLQIPNDYFLSKRFSPKFDENFEIRPARFLVRLLLEDELSNYITKEEITYFCLPAKKDNDLESVKQKILKYRSSSSEEKDMIKEQIASNYDSRGRKDKIQRDFGTSHADIAHTFMLLIEYTGLAVYRRGESLRIPEEKKKVTEQKMVEMEERYPFNYRYKLSLEAFAVNAGLDIHTYKANPYHGIKPATREGKGLLKARRLLAEYPDVAALTEEKIVSILSTELDQQQAEKLAKKLSSPKAETINQDFFDSYLKESDDRAFEDKTGKIIEAFGFKVDMRPKPSNRHSEGDRTEIEIIVHINDEEVCILDAKNYGQKFPLSKNLANYMATEYIPIYQQYQEKKVRYFGYVTANGFSGVKNLIGIKEMAEQNPINVPVDGMMINGKTLLSLLDYCLSNDMSNEEKREAFVKMFNNRAYDSLMQMDI